MITRFVKRYNKVSRVFPSTYLIYFTVNIQGITIPCKVVVMQRKDFVWFIFPTNKPINLNWHTRLLFYGYKLREITLHKNKLQLFCEII